MGSLERTVSVRMTFNGTISAVIDSCWLGSSSFMVSFAQQQHSLLLLLYTLIVYLKSWRRESPIYQQFQPFFAPHGVHLRSSKCAVSLLMVCTCAPHGVQFRSSWCAVYLPDGYKMPKGSHKVKY